MVINQPHRGTNFRAHGLVQQKFYQSSSSGRSHFGISRQGLCSGSRQKRIPESRAVLALLVRDIEDLQLTMLSRELKRDLSGLSQGAGQLDQKLKSNKELEKIVNSIRKLFP